MNEHGSNAMTDMSLSYDLIIEEDGHLNIVEVWAVNKEGAVNEWRGKKGKIRGIVFNDKNNKHDEDFHHL